MNKIIHKRSTVITDGIPKLPNADALEYGEIAINYAKDGETISLRNSSDEIVEFRSKKYFEDIITENEETVSTALNNLNSRINGLAKDYVNADGVLKTELQGEIDAAVMKLQTNTTLSFYCIEPVTVIINNEETTYDTNTLVNINLRTDDEFSIVTTSDNSISTLLSWPKALNTYYSWLEGVKLFDGILFDMNSEDMYTKWNQGNQGLYGVQFAQYKNCIFWSDLGYISDVAKRTNYTLYNSFELPLCYSTIPDNTFKAFYFAYNVTSDPNWANSAYKESFAKATWATQVFSYYGLHSIGLFDMDSTRFNITLPKDCRGLMFYAPNVLNAGVFDAINTTNFGAKSGSWRDAFAYCYQLKNLYIKNLKVSINVSWSPITQEALNFILTEAANTNKITISLSPQTYYSLTEANKTLAAEKNITLELLATNVSEDNRLKMLQITGDGNSFLSNDGTYKTIEVPDVDLSEYYTKTEMDSKNYTTTTYVDQKVANLVNGAPETLDTLDELAAALHDNKDIVTVLNNSITNKADAVHNHDDQYYTESEINTKLSGKQDTIADLATIRTNAAKGATALQEIPSEYVTESELTDYAKLSDIETMINNAITTVLNTEV